MKSIEVDFDVWKTLTSMRKNEEDTYNDVLRLLLNLPSKPNMLNRDDFKGKPFIAKGIEFEEGTEFRALYNGHYYYGKVINGSLVVDGVKYSSVSSALSKPTNKSLSGWNYWYIKRPGSDEWTRINSLRKR